MFTRFLRTSPRLLRKTCFINPIVKMTTTPEAKCKCSHANHGKAKSNVDVIHDINDFDAVLPVRELTDADNEAVESFKRFLRIRSITSEGPQGANDEVMEFLSDFFTSIGVKYEILTFVEGYPVFLATIPGTEPELPGILLNSHYDVVPVIDNMWHWPPFAATELENGDIVARGAQDMKSVCIQYCWAVKRLKESGWAPRRTCYLAFQPDEELGGKLGMGRFVESDKFPNVAFALDEGLASEDGKTVVFKGERTVWWLKIRSSGPTGHASRFVQDTAVPKLLQVLNRFSEYRAEQEAKLDGGCKHAAALLLGDVVTLNITALEAGVRGLGSDFAYNVIPQEAMAGIDIRIPPHISLADFEAEIRSWLLPGMEYEFVVKSETNHVTSTDERENPFWGVFQRACKEVGVELDTQIFPAATDGRWMRAKNIPVMGFSPISHQPILLHREDERLNKFVFLQGIDVYTSIVKALTNMSAEAGLPASRQ